MRIAGPNSLQDLILERHALGIVMRFLRRPVWYSRFNRDHRLENNWIDVPDDAVITEPNRAGRTVVWPMPVIEGDTIRIRCFMPGSMT